MKILKQCRSTIIKAVDILKSGGLVIYPTETVYGVGVDATNENAVNRLNLYKNRPLGKPYSIAVLDKLMAKKYAVLNNVAINLYDNFLPGPLTVVSKGKHLLANGVESEYGTLGVRIPNYKIVLSMIKMLKKPITATSANASYKKRPYKISDILDNLSDKQKSLIDLIIDAGELPKNEPSTVVDTTMDDLVTLRQGDINLTDTNEVFSTSEESTQNFGKELWQKYEKYFGKRPIVFALKGPMGSGKTQFTKGVGKSLEISENISSPRFNIINEYTANNGLSKLIHIDVWRLKTSDEILSLGFNEMLKNTNYIFVIEWAEKIVNVLREHSEDTIIVWVEIKYAKKQNERLIKWGSL